MNFQGRSFHQFDVVAKIVLYLFLFEPDWPLSAPRALKHTHTHKHIYTQKDTKQSWGKKINKKNEQKYGQLDHREETAHIITYTRTQTHTAAIT